MPEKLEDCGDVGSTCWPRPGEMDWNAVGFPGTGRTVRMLQLPFLPHALVHLLLKYWFALSGWLRRTLALEVSVGIVPLSLGCPSHQPVEYKCVLWAAVAGEILLPGQMVAVVKSLDLFLLTLSVAVLSCSPWSPWESESKGSWVQTALGRTQHQRCFPRVIPPRNQGSFMRLNAAVLCLWHISFPFSFVIWLSFWLTK